MSAYSPPRHSPLCPDRCPHAECGEYREAMRRQDPESRFWRFDQERKVPAGVPDEDDQG